MRLPKLNLFVLALLSLLTFTVRSQKVPAVQRNSLTSVRIFVPPLSQQRLEVISLLQLDHFIEKDGVIQAEIGYEDLVRLKASGLQYEILVDDVAANLKKVNKAYYEARRRGTINIDGSPKQTAGNERLAFEQPGSTVAAIIKTPAAFEVKSTFGGYYSYAEMEAAVNALVAAYPTIVKKTSIGTSYEGRTLWCVKISDNVATDEAEPEVLFMGLQHAREAIGGSSMIFLMQYLCENYDNDQRVKDLINNREIFIIPAANPDGWEYNRTSAGAGGGWRKNRRNSGVDLNRNWGVDWGNCSAPIQGTASSCGSSSSGSDTYYGASAFSEPETKAIRDFTYTRNFVAMIDQHSYGPYYSLPYGRPSLHPAGLSAIDDKFYTSISSAMGTYNGMRAGNSFEALHYEVAGGVKDWMLNGNIGTGTKGKVYGMTGEGGAGGGTGGSYGSFWPPSEQIVNLCKGMVFQDLQLLLAAGSYVNLEDAGDINLSGKTGSFTFTVIRTGLEDKTVNVSVVPIENISSVGVSASFNLASFGDTYSGGVSYTLPAAITNGQRVRFAWKIQTGGITYYDTVVKFYNATQLLYDNMEGTFGTNWTSSPATGAWGLTSAGTGYGGGTSKAVSESPSGNYAQNATRILTCKSNFNLSGSSAAWLSFWVRHRAENFHDKLQVQVSNDGGTSWTAISGSTTIKEPGTLDESTINGIPALTGVKEDWTRELFDLSAYLGSSALQLRFVFTSDADDPLFSFSEDDGFYIDELKVVRSNATLVALPVTFTSFTAALTPAHTVLLEWSAETDAKYSHFVVEKSGDGNSFSAIGKVEIQPYQFIDPAPLTGVNYYRIRAVDIDGKSTYTRVNTVYFNPSMTSIQIYPNPAEDDLNLRFNLGRTESTTIVITDISGRPVYSKYLVVGAGNAEIKIRVRDWPAQTYVIKVIRADNSCLLVRKFIKQ